MCADNNGTKSQKVKDEEARREAAQLKAQALVRRYVPEGVSLVDELIREHRAEAAREADR